MDGAKSRWERMTLNRRGILRRHNEKMARLDVAIEAMDAVLKDL
ncbi:hypothetical protein Hden_1896 [Hyphomicrobium denitrificans ATCC 51888]|uniref:Uncharacterized protein n=2 Tax=Hyphomicrobium denitrificans TaxID=53399 RepID=D8JZ97_HYPDA|nr:hypothetical protein Hden_1896 [Hyphomicrobium denitrificans ATCC 51888]